MSQRRLISCSLLFLLVVITSPVWGQPPDRPFRGAGPMNGISFLNRALEDAGATALSSDQETQIQALLDSIRKTLVSQEPDAELQAALSAYQQAVLSGNLTGARSAATALAAKETQRSQTRLEQQADWIIQLTALLTADQLNKLIAKFETAGTFRILERLVGPMGRGFPGVPGAGPMMGRRPRE
jgi:hypothetical protein